MLKGLLRSQCQISSLRYLLAQIELPHPIPPCSLCPQPNTGTSKLFSLCSVIASIALQSQIYIGRSRDTPAKVDVWKDKTCLLVEADGSFPDLACSPLALTQLNSLLNPPLGRYPCIWHFLRDFRCGLLRIP